MKTPREVILECYQSAVPALDRIRTEVIASELLETRRSVSQPERSRWSLCWRTLWRELFLPYRRTWAGVGMIWLVLLAANFGNSREAEYTGPSVSSADVMAVRELERQLLAELLHPQPVEPADLPPKGPPQAYTRRVAGRLTA